MWRSPSAAAVCIGATFGRVGSQPVHRHQGKRHRMPIWTDEGLLGKLYDYTCEPATNVCAISGQAPRALLVNPNPPHAPRRTASLAGFLDFSHVLHGPLRYGASIRFETMPSRPMPLSTWLAGQAIRTIERAIRMAESSALFVSDGEFIRSARCGGRLSERQPAVSPSEHRCRSRLLTHARGRPGWRPLSFQKKPRRLGAGESDRWRGRHITGRLMPPRNALRSICGRTMLRSLFRRPTVLTSPNCVEKQGETG